MLLSKLYNTVVSSNTENVADVSSVSNNENNISSSSLTFNLDSETIQNYSDVLLFDSTKPTDTEESLSSSNSNNLTSATFTSPLSHNGSGKLSTATSRSRLSSTPVSNLVQTATPITTATPSVHAGSNQESILSSYQQIRSPVPSFRSESQSVDDYNGFRNDIATVLRILIRKVDEFGERCSRQELLVTTLAENIRKEVHDSVEFCLTQRGELKNELLESLSEKFNEVMNDNSIMRAEWSTYKENINEVLNEADYDHDSPHVDTDDDESCNINQADDSSSTSSTSSTQPHDNHHFDTRFAELNQKLRMLQEQLFEQDCRIIECEQYSRRENLIISGIPDSVTDDQLRDKIVDILADLDIDVNYHDISTCHRLGRSNRGYPARVIVRFTNRQIVHDCLAIKHTLKNKRRRLGMNLRFFENLSKSNEECLRMCKWLKESNVIHDYFLRNGFVKAVETEGSKPFKIRHPDIIKNTFRDIEDFPDFPDHH